jgi:hypothetical protein
MSESPILPLPRLRELWEAQTGTKFFLKWMLCAGIGVALRAAIIATFYQTGAWGNPLGTFLYYSIPVLIQESVLFGLRWKTLAWVAISGGFLGAWLSLRFGWIGQFTPLGVETLLLSGVRHRAILWIPASLAAYLLQLAVIGNTPIQASVRESISKLPLGRFGSFLAFTQFNLAVQLAMGAILGATLAWLMPPKGPYLVRSNTVAEPAE